MAKNSNNKDNNTPSPCINKCQLNEHEICTGCYRSITEIVEWAKSSEIQKAQALAHCEQRKLIQKI